MSRYGSLKKYLSAGEALSIYLKIKMGNYENFHVSKLKFPFSMRNNPYDYATFEEVILREAYNIPINFIPYSIIDGGGNIGLTAAYFATKYPQASIVSLEPDKDNFNLLQQNTKAYKNVKAINKGIWNKQTDLVISNVGMGNNGFTVDEANENSFSVIPSLCIADIMQIMNWEHIDLLKLDVEGSEKEIFSGNYENWLPKTKVLIVEIHDRMKKGCSKAVFSAINNYNFSFSLIGENLVFTNESFL